MTYEKLTTDKRGVLIGLQSTVKMATWCSTALYAAFLELYLAMKDPEQTYMYLL